MLNLRFATTLLALCTLPLSAFAQDADDGAGQLPPKAATPAVVLPTVAAHKTLKVAVYSGPGASVGKSDAVDALAKDPNLTVDRLTPDDIKGGKLAGYDILVQPGGSGSGQAKALGEDGREQIRQFVKGGGGYVGICGGSYLASDDYPWSLGIINTKVLDKAHWARGHGPVNVHFAPEGQSLLTTGKDDLSIVYWQGPIMAPKNDPKLPPYTELAKFTTEVHRDGVPGGVMPGQTAVASAPYGKGKVICFSPHPEKTPGLESILHRAILWETDGAKTGATATTTAAK